MTENCPPFPAASASPSRLHTWRGLLIALLIVASLWGILLPWLSQRAVIADHIELQRHHGIDPSAMYYSELETLPPIVHRLEKLHTTNHDELWGR